MLCAQGVQPRRCAACSRTVVATPLGARATIARAAEHTDYRRSVRAAAGANKSELDLLAATCPVPREQQPIMQLKALEEDATFDLASQPLPQFGGYLFKMFFGFYALMAFPVSCVTFDIAKEPAQCLLSAAAGSLFIVTVRWRSRAA